MKKKRTIVTVCLAVGALLLCGLPLAAQDAVNRPTAFGVSAPLGELAQLPQSLHYGFHEANPVRRIPKRSFGKIVDGVEQNRAEGPEAGVTIGANFLGVGNGFPNYSVPDAPPDTNMAVGDTQVLQWVNTSYTVCSKVSPYACGPAIEGNTIWSGLAGSLCANNNDGDIISQWDVTAHRWVLTQNVFVSPYAVCLAISTTPDATGTYFLYEFAIPGNGFPDYPKWGIWPTNYGQSQNNFGPGGSGFVGPLACVYNRAKLLAGDPTAEQICHQYTSSEDSLLPGDQDSATNPPSGQDQFFIGSVGDVDDSHLSLYSAHINNLADWSQGATFTGDGNSQLIAIATFTPACNGNFGGACVPQVGVSDLLDSLGDRLMYRFAYWNDGSGGSQHWLVNFDVTASNSQNGVRWMEITAAPSEVGPSGLSVFQQGTYAPDGNWRWMGSVARDQVGDILVGYSESGTAIHPSIFVAGRTASDSPGTLEPEVLLVAGTGSQPDTANRWGDYSSMRIDQDGCTFWYTTEYYMVTQRFDWSTQIGSFTFPGCGGGGTPDFSLSANPNSVTITQGSSGTSTITVNDLNGFSGSVNLSASGLPSGVTAGFSPNPTSTTSTLTLSASGTAATGTVTVTITGMSGALTHTTTLSLTVNPTGTGPAVTLVPTSLSFGTIVLGSTSKAKTVTMTNTGNQTLNITNIAASGDFALTTSTKPCGSTLAVGANCKIAATFTPTQLGSRTGAITITDNAANSPQTVPLSGTGKAQVTLTPVSATYPKTLVGSTSTPKIFTLRNNLNTILHNIVISTTGDFAVSTTNCQANLTSNASCSIYATFTPTQTGTRTGTLQVSDSANNSPQISNLTGTGK
jgi:hypothetical protein